MRAARTSRQLRPSMEPVPRRLVSMLASSLAILCSAVLLPVLPPRAVRIYNCPETWFRVALAVKEQGIIGAARHGEVVLPAVAVLHSPPGYPLDHIRVLLKEAEDIPVPGGLLLLNAFGQACGVAVSPVIPGVHADIQLGNVDLHPQGRIEFNGLPNGFDAGMLQIPVALHTDAVHPQTLLQKALNQSVNGIPLPDIRGVVVVVVKFRFWIRLLGKAERVLDVIIADDAAPGGIPQLPLTGGRVVLNRFIDHIPAFDPAL